MKYRLTCLSPLLVGDGSRLSPIDYMVWKDQVNVLDQRRIFRLLAKGPRLDNYLIQIKRAEKLDFASWGGFAQNFAGRRIPFEHSSYTAYWERLRAENLHIPTFVTGTSGPYLPGSALKGALRTSLIFTRASEGALKAAAAQFQGDRQPRRPAEAAEHQALGGGGHDQMKGLAASDSAPVAVSSMKIYLLRTATLEPKGPDRYTLAWKQSPRGSVEARRVEDSTPTFAEMAPPGTVFEGTWTEKAFYQRRETARSLRWREPLSTAAVLGAGNDYAAQLLAAHQKFAEWTGLSLLGRSLTELATRLEEARQRGSACLLSLGWGGGMLGKTAWPGVDESYKELLRQVAVYSRAIRSGLPFPKTRRIVFVGNQPTSLPGWALLEIV